MCKILSTARAIDCSVCVRSNHIGDGVFLIRRVTFIEKFYLLYNIFSFRDEHLSGICQNRYYSCQNFCRNRQEYLNNVF